MHSNCRICAIAFKGYLTGGICDSCAQDLLFKYGKVDRTPKPPKHKGWECPKCLAVMAPHVDVCNNCKGILYSEKVIKNEKGL